MILSRRLVLSASLAFVPMVAAPAFAADDVMKARRVVDEAVYAVEGVRDETARSGELDSLLAEAVGVLVIPKFYKAGFIIGGAYGDGVLVGTLPSGEFSDPAFYRMTAGSIGLQIGMQSSAMVFVIRTEKGMSAVLNDEFKLGANVGIAVGTVGAGAEAATTTHVGQDIVAYSTNAGLFAGGSFEGAVIKPRKDWNAAVYGIDNGDPRAIIQRSGLRAANNLKDALMRTRTARPGRTESAPAPSAAPAAPAANYSPTQPETMAPAGAPITREPLSNPVNR